MIAKSDSLNLALYRLHRVFYIAIAVLAAITLAIGARMLIADDPDSGIGLAGLYLVPLGALHCFAADGARGKQQPYSFSTPEQLMDDFLADVRCPRGEL